MYFRWFRTKKIDFKARPYSIRASPVSLFPLSRFSRIYNPHDSLRIEKLGKTHDERSRQVDVHLKEDPYGVLRHNVALLNILGNPTLVIQRKMEMMNVFFGFEQANKYIVMDSTGKHVGYIAETGDQSITKIFARQILRTNRAFKAHILDREGNEVLLIERPFSWINSKIRVIDRMDSSYPIVGEVQQQWHAWRRKYNLFLKRDDIFSQFAYIDEPLFSWDFSLIDQEGGLIGSVNRNFMGLLQEMFTDTGNYVLRMDSVSAETNETTASKELININGRTDALVPLKRGLTLDERAVILATAICIDFDYFSKLSKGGAGIGSFFPFWFPIFGGGTHDNPTEQPESTSTSEGQDSSLPSNDEPSKPEETEKKWWDLSSNNDVWGEGDQDPWNDSNQNQDNDSWGGFFEEDD
ncbi:hypothetical protein T552_01013 [Pneumocystis carinii B80]|uniref:Phospholipid scramblase n=1 Tax=Pneumocystis carinii (strain B80) TaxID=1408658 RepID=A0A0W4ZN65_PNEC8|nr:hypothetical protein T552_01013 [Pneumocystis carinii B80]KTW29808.1 hypothetical protein T552_01013 [Pneumocystis carinii B80]